MVQDPPIINGRISLDLKTLKEIQVKAFNSASQADLEAIKHDVELLKLKTAPIINGGIVMIWQKPVSEIPAGWKECTDLRGKTIFGRDPNDPLFENLGSSLRSSSKKILKKHLQMKELRYILVNQTTRLGELRMDLVIL